MKISYAFIPHLVNDIRAKIITINFDTDSTIDTDLSQKHEKIKTDKEQR